MANQIGELAVKLTAQTSQFSNAMRSAQDATRSFSGSMGAMGNGITGAIGKIFTLKTAVLGLATGAMVHFIDSTLQTAAAIQDLSDRTGASSAKIIGLQKAAADAGSSAEAIASTLDTLQKNIGMFGMGAGKAKKAFEELGITFEQLRGLDAVEQFKLIGASISGISDASTQAALSAKIFGSAGEELVNLFDSGVGAIDQFAAAAMKSGEAFDELTGKQIAAADDAMVKLKGTLMGISRQLVIQLVPFIEKAAISFTEFAEQGGGIGPKIGKGFDGTIRKVAFFMDMIQKLHRGLLLISYPAVTLVGWLASGFHRAANAVVILSMKLADLADPFNDSSDFIRTFTENAIKDTEKIDATFASMKESIMNSLIEIDSASYGERAEEFINGIGEASKKAAEEVVNLAAKIKEANNAADAPGKKILDDLTGQSAAAKGFMDMFTGMAAAQAEAGKKAVDMVIAIADAYKKAADQKKALMNIGDFSEMRFGASVLQGAISTSQKPGWRTEANGAMFWNHGGRQPNDMGIGGVGGEILNPTDMRLQETNSILRGISEKLTGGVTASLA